MSGQMCWLQFGQSGDLILHLRNHPREPWRLYKNHPAAVADYPVPRGSKGWATYQKLRCAGWTLIPTKDAYRSIPFSTLATVAASTQNPNIA
jgi:hypothetical protein